MRRKRHSAEEIIAKLREADVLLGQGRTVAEVARALAINATSYDRWRAEYGGMKISQAKRLKDLERENARLRKAVADLTLDKMVLQEAAEGNFSEARAPPGCLRPVQQVLGVSERGACRALGQHRSTRRHEHRSGTTKPR